MAFQAYAARHAVQAGANRLGHTLFAVVGRQAAVPGFHYSPSLKSAELTWDPAMLEAFIAAPRTVASSSMAYPGVADRAKRQDIIAYPRTLKQLSRIR